MKTKKLIDINIQNTTRDKSLHSGERSVSKEAFENIGISNYSFAAKYIKEDDFVLDVGCGVGYGSSYIAKKNNCTVLGIDDSFETIQYARQQNDSIEFEIYDMVDPALYPSYVTHNKVKVILVYDFLNSFADPVIAMGNLAKFRAKYIIGTTKEKQENKWDNCLINIKGIKHLASIAGYQVIDHCSCGGDIFFVMEKTDSINSKLFYQQNKSIKHSVSPNVLKKCLRSSSSINNKKILILGSGPSAVDIKNIDIDGWHVIAINNAWQLGKWDALIYPNDFYKLPPEEEMEKKHIIDYLIYNDRCKKYGLQKDKGDSMIFNAAYYALSLDPGIIAFLGCDLYYAPQGDTHFYGKGGPDPLRLGVDNLLSYLYRLKEKAAIQKVKMYNASKAEKSMLPFQRINICLKKKALFIAFNKPFIKYAEAFISSFYRNGNDDYDVVCFTVGINKTKLLSSGYPWNSKRIKIYNQNKTFKDMETEACYMNSMRFVLYAAKLKDYDFIYMSDADTICSGKLKILEDDMIGKDIGLIFTGKFDCKKYIRACSIAVNVSDKIKIFFDEYKKNIDLLYGNNEWYNDQLAIYKIIIENKFAYDICNLDVNKYCAFYKKHNGLFVATATKDKLMGNYYTELFMREQKIIKENR